MDAYQKFLATKSQIDIQSGFDPIWMPDFLFDFQKHLVEWAVRKGRAALFADCGLGKTPMQLVWAENVVRKTNRPVLILTPLAVAYQTCREADKFGIEAHRSNDGTAMPNITVTNYERLEKYQPGEYSGVVCYDDASFVDCNSVPAAHGRGCEWSGSDAAFTGLAWLGTDAGLRHTGTVSCFA